MANTKATLWAMLAALIGLSLAISGASLLWAFDTFAADVRAVVEYVAPRVLPANESGAIESGSLDIIIVHGPPTGAARGIQLMIFAMLLGGVPAAILAMTLARRAEVRGEKYAESWAHVFLAGFIFQLGSIFFGSLFFLMLALEFVAGLQWDALLSDWPIVLFETCLLVIVVGGCIALRSWRRLRASAVKMKWIDLSVT